MNFFSYKIDNTREKTMQPSTRVSHHECIESLTKKNDSFITIEEEVLAKLRRGGLMISISLIHLCH